MSFSPDRRGGDIHPRTPTSQLQQAFAEAELRREFPIDLVCAVVGMSPSYVRRTVPHANSTAALAEVLALLTHDAFGETFVQRSAVPQYLLSLNESLPAASLVQVDENSLLLGSARDVIAGMPPASVGCVVTSTPYWGTRLYDTSSSDRWADGEISGLGDEQTPEGFIRHTCEILWLLRRVLVPDASVWWNVMDTYNTRTQIRGNASETLKAMKGSDNRSWKEYERRRYSAGHSFLKDGEQCLIPQRIAERASRLGYFVKSVITWKKAGSLPETVSTRVTRELEYVLHLSMQRSPFFDKSAFRRLPQALGGRNPQFEGDKLTDVWVLPTSTGRGGHGAQFPLQLPARCIALTTRPGDLVLDPFVGSGTACVAAAHLGRSYVGIDVSADYLEVARRRLREERLLPYWQVDGTEQRQTVRDAANHRRQRRVPPHRRL